MRHWSRFAVSKRRVPGRGSSSPTGHSRLTFPGRLAVQSCAASGVTDTSAALCVTMLPLCLRRLLAPVPPSMRSGPLLRLCSGLVRSARVSACSLPSPSLSAVSCTTCVPGLLFPRALCELSSVYMRTLRRVAGEMRFSALQCRLTDLEVRKMVNEQSFDCCLARARLNLLAAVLRAPSPPLRCLLSVRGPRGEQLPWVDLVVQDMVALREFYPTKLAEPGDPTVQWDRWLSFICGHPQAWKTFVKGFLYHDSVLDRPGAGARVQSRSACLPLHSCAVCADDGRHVAFPS